MKYRFIETFFEMLGLSIIIYLLVFVFALLSCEAKADHYIIYGDQAPLPIIMYDTPSGVEGFDYNTNEHIRIQENIDGSYDVFESFDSPPTTIRRLEGTIDSFGEDH